MSFKLIIFHFRIFITKKMKNIDFFAEPVKIMLNKQNTIQTSIGGFFTIFTILLVFLFTWFMGRDIIYKQNPFSYTQTNIADKFRSMNITKKTFPFSFILTDDNNVPLFDYSYFSIKLYYLEFELNSENNIYELLSKTEIKTKSCEYGDFPIINKDLFDNAQLGSTLCIKEKNFEYNLKGYWNEAKLNFLQINIEQCKEDEVVEETNIINDNINTYLSIPKDANNSINISDEASYLNTSNTNKTPTIILSSGNVNSNYTSTTRKCKNNQEIHKYVAEKGVNLNIYFIETKVAINNNTNPIEFSTSSSYKYPIPEYYKKSIYKIESHNILTDNGIIFNSDESIQFYKMIEEFTDIRHIDENDIIFLSMEIYSSNVSQTYYRRYVKVPDIIASLGGILKVFNLAFLYLNTIFSKVEKNISIVNKVFVLNKKNNNLQKDFSLDSKFKNKYNHLFTNNQNISRLSINHNENNQENVINNANEIVCAITNKNNHYLPLREDMKLKNHENNSNLQLNRNIISDIRKKEKIKNFDCINTSNFLEKNIKNVNEKKCVNKGEKDKINKKYILTINNNFKIKHNENNEIRINKKIQKCRSKSISISQEESKDTYNFFNFHLNKNNKKNQSQNNTLGIIKDNKRVKIIDFNNMIGSDCPFKNNTENIAY